MDTIVKRKTTVSIFMRTVYNFIVTVVNVTSRDIIIIVLNL